MADKPSKPVPTTPLPDKPGLDSTGLAEHIAKARKNIASTRELLKPRKDDRSK